MTHSPKFGLRQLIVPEIDRSLHLNCSSLSNVANSTASREVGSFRESLLPPYGFADSFFQFEFLRRLPIAQDPPLPLADRGFNAPPPASVFPETGDRVNSPRRVGLLTVVGIGRALWS